MVHWGASLRNCVVNLAAFRAWVESLQTKWVLPERFPRRANSVVDPPGTTPSVAVENRSVGRVVHAPPSDGAPRATWQLGLEALMPALEASLERPARVRKVIRHLKENGSAYRIDTGGGPDQLFWKTLMDDRKTIGKKTISNAISDWRKSRLPA